LPNLAKSAGLKNFKAGTVEGTENANGVQFAEIKGRGETDGTPLVVVITGFQAQPGRFYALFSVGTEKTDRKHGSDYEGIVASIELLKATAKKESDAGLPIVDTTLGWDSKTGYVSVYFQAGGKCTIDFQGNEARGVGNSRMTKSYEVTSLPGSKWRVRILLDDPQDITFRTTKVNPAARNGETVIAAMGINEGDPYQRGQEGQLKFVRGKQSRPPE
jgi:hypothetical protein